MIITLSEFYLATQPATADLIVTRAARLLNLHFNVKRIIERRKVRGELLNITGVEVASEAQHDKFFAALFDLDPDAYIRTSRAIYDTRVDYQAQLKAGVA